MTWLYVTPQWAWVAGIVEGEGSLTWVTDHRSGRSYAHLAVNMTDLDVLERLFEITQAGHITGPRQVDGHKPIWRWRVTKQADVKAVVDGIYPLLCSRRRVQFDPSRIRLPAMSCGKGHEFTVENTYIRPGNGTRQCRKCRDAHRKAS